MKKLLLFLLPILMLSACNSNQSTSSKDDSGATETDKAKRYEFDLTKDNLWYFIDSAYSTSGNSNYYSCNYVFQGVLSYAYYDNVIVHLDYNIVGQGGGYYPEGTYYADIEVKLNAAGNGGVSLDYEYIPSNITPAFTGTSLYGYSRTLSIKSVSGTVRFAI
ncbi:MAG: hypothetical protein J5955_04885 [Bacilli bacterium]|nr:hypothetical protein [Bacilli bacterium]